MIFEVLTLFPGLFASFMAESMMARALARGLVRIEIVDIREFARGTHRMADDRPFGGGPGMVMMPGPLCAALDSRVGAPGIPPLVVHLTPAGRRLDQSLVRELRSRRRLVMVCGRYGGVDARVAEIHPGMELSVGDYVLNGGEIPAMAVMEAVSRLVPGFLGECGSLEGESFTEGTLAAPQYTRPRVFRGLAVPDVLLSGNHRAIDLYRRGEAARVTRAARPDLLDPDAGQAPEADAPHGASGSPGAGDVPASAGKNDAPDGPDAAESAGPQGPEDSRKP
ncbi:MAG: tRNA (guanosine(37)-N1)-methyltransferase TrmD [Deltaproteobacteria bacterium]|nr:tRNA (guanosine(37)-N1)-methyltransferase TrmD [Deltaproteobacteria bacterium]